MTFEQFKLFRCNTGLAQDDAIAVSPGRVTATFGSGAIEVNITWEGAVHIRSPYTTLTLEQLTAFERAQRFIIGLKLPDKTAE